VGLINRFRPTEPESTKRFNLEALLNQVNYLGHNYPLGLQQTMLGGDTEGPDTSFRSMVEGAYRSGGPVFSCILARAMLFSEARFQWQELRDGRPGKLFGTPDLAVLEQPWPTGTTREMLWRAEQDVSLSGNFYLRKFRDRLWRLRPDYMHIVLGSQTDAKEPAAAIDAEVIGYLWGEPGSNNKEVLMPEEVVHWSPIPDPMASYRGMSWITPVAREVGADRGATTHKGRFFENAATPNLVVMPDATVSYDEFKPWKEEFQDQHEGAWNAYKTLFLGGGSTIQSVGLDFKAMDFKGVQGSGETRIAAAANVPPIIAGFSEGLSSATYSNYGQARRKFGDHFARPQWGSFAAAVAKIVPPPRSGVSRLWYDDRDIAFLREDQGDEADIRQKDAATVRTLVEAGFEPDAAVSFVQSGNLVALEGNHSGNVSVQLQPADGSGNSAGGTFDVNQDDEGAATPN